MEFTGPLIEGTLVRRYKRFLVDVELPDGALLTAHTANPGRMTGLTAVGSRVWLSDSQNPKRKLPHTWELIEIDGDLVGVNPALANALVAEALDAGRIEELTDYAERRREVPYGERRSRVDFLLSDPERRDCYLEVKNVTLLAGEAALFPDAPSERGRKHLRELMDVVAGGARAVLLFVVQRPEAQHVGPAAEVDPEYAALLAEAQAAGVEVLAYRADVSLAGIELTTRLPTVIPAFPFVVGSPSG